MTDPQEAMEQQVDQNPLFHGLMDKLFGEEEYATALWQPPVELSAQEEQIVKRIRRAKLFVFLRHHRHELFNEAFQQELASLYRQSKRGHPPTAPAQLALAVILQAYTGVSDDEVIEVSFIATFTHSFSESDAEPEQSVSGKRY